MISILMPLYNGGEFLPTSAGSVINQTVSDWELLIGLNGVEPNKCGEIIACVNSLHDERIKVIAFSHKGKVKTLNKILEYAKYDKICLLDVDDCWLPEKLEKQLPFIERYDVVGTNCEYFGNDTGFPQIFLGELSAPMFSFQNPFINSSIMLTKANAHWDEAWDGLDDYNLWIDLAGKGKTFYNLPEALTKHRLHNESFYSPINGDLSHRLREEKIPRLAEEHYVSLGVILDNKQWKLWTPNESV
jgi:glycosyltransferase involved in cell wall biosynthesis